SCWWRSCSRCRPESSGPPGACSRGSRGGAESGGVEGGGVEGGGVEGGGVEVSLLVTKDLVKWFGETHAVDHVNFTVKESEVLALIGSNGAGKTTLVNLIS